MSSPAPPNYSSTPPPVQQGNQSSTSVRRHHTISASSRAVRNRPLASEETQEAGWNQEEEVVASNENWVISGLGAVGSGLHRQSSLPSRYNRGFNQGVAGRRSGTQTPRTMNSLSAIAAEHGLEGDGEDAEWEREISGWQGEEEQQHHPLPSPPMRGGGSPANPEYDTGDAQAQPLAASGGVRRHQSLTYGAHQNKQRTQSGLKRSGTMLATAPGRGRSPQPPQDIQDEEEEEEYAEQVLQEQPRFPQLDSGYSTRQAQSPWAAAPNRDWGNSGSTVNQSMPQVYDAQSGNTQVDDIQRALASLDMTPGQPAAPPRFSGTQGMGLRSSPLNPQMRPAQGMIDGNGNLLGGFANSSPYNQMVQGARNGRPQGNGQSLRRSASSTRDDDISFTPGSQNMLRNRNSNPNMQYLQEAAYGNPMPPVPPIPTQYLHQPAGGQAPRMGMNPIYGNNQDPNFQGAQDMGDVKTDSVGMDVPTLIAAKGYNPAEFDTNPLNARYFVIKSYTEEDVHKSLKYEIWSSTDPGNKRLDKAFKECAGRGPIYLFFSVNTSGHFCGIAEMLTPLDYSRSSTVWASDKWKGVFKVRWIFVRDIPNAALRHIKLLNTQERKPVTNSRDTQELLPEAGQEMLRIFHTHLARTSLLQDYAFYEIQAIQKQAQPFSSPPSETQSPPPGSPVLQAQSPPHVYQQHPYAMTNPSPMAIMHQYQGAGNGGQMFNSAPTFNHHQTARGGIRDATPNSHLGGRRF